MLQSTRKARLLPLLYGSGTLLILLAVTYVLVHQRQSLIRADEQEELIHELHATKDKFEVALTLNISSAKTMAILYKQDETLSAFDSVASELIQLNKFIDIVQFTDKYVMAHIYPLQGNEKLMGLSVLDFPERKAEANIAFAHKEVLFAGPYDLIQGGGKAIVGRVPVFVNNEFRGFSAVVTRLSTIRRLIPEFDNKGGKFVYQLSKKNPVTGKTEHFFEGYDPQKDERVSVYMPQGNWILHVAFAKSYSAPGNLLLVAALGILLSVLGAAFAYYKTHEAQHLETEVEKRTHELGERVAQLRTLIEASPVGFMLCDTEFRIIATNARMVSNYIALTGKVMQPGENFIDLTLPDRRENIRAAFSKVLHDMQPIEYDTSYPLDGSMVYVTVTVSPVVSNGEVIGLCMAAYDITTRKQMELDRQRIIEDLVQRNKALEDFAHVVSHDVRAPLSTILGLSDLLMAADEKERAVIMKGIVQSSHELDKVLKDLNDMLQVDKENQ